MERRAQAMLAFKALIHNQQVDFRTTRPRFVRQNNCSDVEAVLQDRLQPDRAQRIRGHDADADRLFAGLERRRQLDDLWKQTRCCISCWTRPQKPRPKLYSQTMLHLCQVHYSFGSTIPCCP